MPALFCTVRRTPLLWVMDRLMEREVTDQGYIPYPYIASVEGVKKLTNTETPLNFNAISECLRLMLYHCSRKMWDRSHTLRILNTLWRLPGKYADCSATHVNSTHSSNLEVRKFLHMVTTEVTKWQLMKNYDICKQGYHYNTFYI